MKPKQATRNRLGALVLTAVLPLATGAGAEETPGDFVRGARAWADHCQRCHNVRDPKELRDDQWKTTTNHMRIRGGLTADEVRDILTFLQGSN